MKSKTAQKLDEAKYFYKSMVIDFKKYKKEYVHHLNAFLNSARNVTFVMQKEYSSTEGFAAWYDTIKLAMPADFRDFTEIRNISLKEKSIEPYLFSSSGNLFPKGITLLPGASAEVTVVVNEKAKKIVATAVHSDGKVETATRPLLTDFVIYEAANKAHKEVIIDDFIQISKFYLEFLDIIVEDCDKRFAGAATQPDHHT